MLDHRISYKLKCHVCGVDVIRKTLTKNPVCSDCTSMRAKEYYRLTHVKKEREDKIFEELNEFAGIELGTELDRLAMSLHQEWIINKDIDALKILIKMLQKEYEKADT